MSWMTVAGHSNFETEELCLAKGRHSLMANRSHPYTALLDCMPRLLTGLRELVRKLMDHDG